MSRVLACTSMISDEMMLNAATTTMIDNMTNSATRSIASASNRLAFMLRQSATTACVATFWAKGANISPTRSGSSVLISIMPTESPSSIRICASSIGMMTKALSKSYTPISNIAATS